HDVDLRGLLVGGEVRLQLEVADSVVVLGDPLARCGGRSTRHVLPRGIAALEVETKKSILARRVLLDVAQRTSAGRGLRLLLDLAEVLDDPVAERPGVVGAVEAERRGSLNGVVDHGGRNASGL